MIFYKELTQAQIESLFTSDLACYEFLADLKWSAGFTCKKCGNTNSCPGKTHFSRRCTKCKKEESATAGTIFHHCRFSISKAFYIAYSVCKGNDEISSYEFARRLSLRQMTCWKFKDKLKKAIEASGESAANWIEILK
ncbi:MAG: hypothetical protein HW421_1550 [Ignavibacteria bacterium]|nr:hypothetical protein [Ignavibacteria bacterium]